MELEKQDYSDKTLGTVRKAFKYLLALPFALVAVITIFPVIAIVVSMALIVLALGVLIVGAWATFFFLAIALGPHELVED